MVEAPAAESDTARDEEDEDEDEDELRDTQGHGYDLITITKITKTPRQALSWGPAAFRILLFVHADRDAFLEPDWGVMNGMQCGFLSMRCDATSLLVGSTWKEAASKGNGSA